MTVKEKITQLFTENTEWTVHELTDKLGASKQMVHIVLNQLVEAGLLQKLGRTPKTVYRIPSAASTRPRLSRAAPKAGSPARRLRMQSAFRRSPTRRR